MEHFKEFENHGFSTIVAYTGKDITEQMIERCFEIDEEFYEQEFSIENSEIKEIIANFGQMCMVLVDKEENQVIGYSYWIPIKPEIFVDFMKNSTMLLNLKVDYCVSFDEPEVNLFQEGEAFVMGYDVQGLHNAIKDIVQFKILKLAQRGTKINCIALESICQYDEEFFVPSIGLKKKFKKNKSIFYCDKYSPRTMFLGSKYSKELLEYYKD